MENATKALLIAAGVLIAIIIITMLVMMFKNIAGIRNAEAEKLETEQIAKFNAGYEAYYKSIMYGVDVITLANKVAENNINNSDSETYMITLKLDDEIINSGEELLARGDFEKKKFKCTGMEYDEVTGRVKEINIRSR